MGYNSDIQWTEATWNPWHGCTKVSAGCKYCYMYRDKDRYGQDPTNVLRSLTKFNDPLKWKEGKLIFTCSWSDFFIEQADQWRNEAWEIIRKTPQHTYQILTKRPERIKDCLPDDWDEGYDNVWIGVSVENQQTATDRMHIMCTFEAQYIFLSIEPLLDQINLSGIRSPSIDEREFFPLIEAFDWVIVGGESGNDTGDYRYRECDIAWMEQIVFDCKLNGVPVFVKQLGTHLSKTLQLKDRHGGDINEWPSSVQIREFPTNN